MYFSLGIVRDIVPLFIRRDDDDQLFTGIVPDKRTETRTDERHSWRERTKHEARYKDEDAKVNHFRR